VSYIVVFFFTHPSTTWIYTLSLHDALPILFAAGIAARFASRPGFTVIWALSKFDLYAPGIEQVGLGPDRILYAQGRKDADVLARSEEHTSELQSRRDLVCRLLLEKKKQEQQ